MLWKTSGKHDQLDGLINNSGIQHPKPVIVFELEDFDRVLDTNLRASFLLCREAVRLMQAQGSGSIANIASIMAPQAHKTISAYHSRARVVGLNKALALELGQQGICCNGIVPVFFATELASGPVKDPEFTSFIYG